MRKSFAILVATLFASIGFASTGLPAAGYSAGSLPATGVPAQGYSAAGCAGSSLPIKGFSTSGAHANSLSCNDFPFHSLPFHNLAAASVSREDSPGTCIATTDFPIVDIADKGVASTDFAAGITRGKGTMKNQAFSDSIIKQVKAIEKDRTIERAGKLLKEKPRTVTASFSPRSMGGKHDFYSEGPYWWPDPANPDGPFIRKDGLRFSGRFENHDDDLRYFSWIVGTHTSAWILTGEEKYVRAAMDHLKAWFIDTTTLMNPNMLYAQAIRGVNTGRGVGIIDAGQLMDIAQSVVILEKSPYVSVNDIRQIKQWFTKFIAWLTTHPYGIDEMNAKNNHGSWWYSQVASYARLVGDKKVMQLCRDRYRNILLPDQMAADGSYPEELARTKPYSYSLFNLDATASLLWIISDKTFADWNHTLPDGRGLWKGLEYMLPFLRDKTKWSSPKDVDHWDEQPEARQFMLFAALAGNNPAWFDLWKSLAEKNSSDKSRMSMMLKNPLIWIDGSTNLEAQNTPVKKPNVVVILSDDIGYSDLGCFGSEIQTPNLDRLANNGLRFTHFYNTARCSPSRASLLTGVYPHQAEMGHLSSNNFIEPGYHDDLSKNVVTMAELFHQAGYSTYMTGKWHLAKEMTVDGDQSNWPRQRGFDRYFGTLNGSGSFYDPGTLISNNTFVAPGKDFYYTDAISDSTVKFIRQHPKEKPFFFYVAYTAAHWPLHAPEKQVAKYKGKYDIGWDSLRVLRFNKLKKLGIISSNCVLSNRSPEVPEWKNEPMKAWQVRRMEVYAAMIDVMDQGIGRIISALDEKGELENTAIFYMQDNGGCAEPQGSDKPEVPPTTEQLVLKPTAYDVVNSNKRPPYTREGRFVRSGRGVMAGPADAWMAYGPEWANMSNTPFRLYKQFAHEGGIATPLIVHWPSGIRSKGAINPQLSHLMDILPTCIDLAGIPYPKTFEARTIIPAEGKSLVPVFNGKQIDRDLMFWEHSGNRAIRAGNWKLVSRVQPEKKSSASESVWELYNLENDPSETINLALKFPEKLNEMAAKWEVEALRTKAKPWPWDK